MKEERIKRYKDKLDYLIRTIKNLKDWTKDINSKDFIEKLELKIQYGIFYAFQISVKLITDLIAMIIKDTKIIPKDDYTNINMLIKEKIISLELANEIKNANGLRNRIVHDYNGMDYNIAYNALIKMLKSFEAFKEVVIKWLKKNS